MGYKVSRITKPKGIEAPAGKKWCALCEDFRPITVFYRNKARSDGLTNYCKTHHLQVDSLCYYRKKQKSKENSVFSAMKQVFEDIQHAL